MKRVVLGIGIILLFTVILVYGSQFVRRVDLSDKRACYYHYRYFDEADNLCNDVVRLDDDDCAALVKMLDGICYFEALDVEKGFTEDYALEFRNEDDARTVILLQYGGYGLIRLNDTKLDHELRQSQATRLYEILEKYHRHSRVLLAG